MSDKPEKSSKSPGNPLEAEPGSTNSPRESAAPRKGHLGRNLLIVVGVLLGVLVLIAGGGYLLFQNYLRSEAFRELIERQTNDALHAQGSYEPFRWSGTSSVFSPAYRAEGEEDAEFARVEALELRAFLDLDAAWDGIWRITELRVGQATVHLDAASAASGQKQAAETRETPVSERSILDDPASAAPPEPAADPVRARPDPALTSAAKPDSPTAGGGEADEANQPDTRPFPRNLLPDQFELRKIFIADANLLWAPQPGQAGSLRGSELVLIPQNDFESWDVSGSGGTFRQQGLPEFQVSEVRVLLDEERLALKNATLQGPGDSRVSATGEITLENARGEVDTDLQAKISQYPLREFLPEEWQERLLGRLNGTVRVTGTPADRAALTAKGHLELADAVIQGVPVLDTIAQYTRNQRFKLLRLEEARTDFRVEDEVFHFTDLVLEDTGLLMVTGSGQITLPRDGHPRINATLRVGVTPATLRWLLGAEKRVFTVNRDGYRWTTMKVTGPIDSPKEDLSPRLKDAFGQEVVDTAQGLLEDVPDDVKERGEEIIEDAGQILRQLFGN